MNAMQTLKLATEDTENTVRVNPGSPEFARLVTDSGLRMS
jgi:hypothetical protein